MLIVTNKLRYNKKLYSICVTILKLTTTGNKIKCNIVDWGWANSKVDATIKTRVNILKICHAKDIVDIIVKEINPSEEYIKKYIKK